MGDSLLERPLRSHHSATQDLRLEHQPDSLLFGERLGRFNPLQSYLRLVTIQVQHCIHEQGCSQGKRVSDPLGQCQCLSPDRQSGIGIAE
jgi:hypothetical protein